MHARNQWNRRLLAVVVLALCASALAVARPASAQPPEQARSGGQNRYETAAAISGLLNQCHVVVANGRSFPDALAGSVFGRTVLLTESDALPDETIYALERGHRRCRPSGLDIVVLGGEAAVSARVLDELRSYGAAVERVAGANRYETAIAVAERFGVPEGHRVLLASGRSFPDALAAGPAAALGKFPILLNDGDELRPDVRSFIVLNEVSEVIILGGTAAVPATIEHELEIGLGIDVHRLGGANRFATASAITSLSRIEDCVVIANGYSFPDALAASPLAHDRRCHILLVDKDKLPPETEAWLAASAGEVVHIHAIGGTGVLSEAVLDQAAEAATP